MTKIIFIHGAPGVGKTTTAKIVYEKIGPPYIELSTLRNLHLKRDWSNTSEEEEKMSFENLVFILNNYIKHNYSHVIVTDVGEPRIQELVNLFSQEQYLIFTLYTNDEVLKERVLEPTRDSGYRNFERAIKINKEILERDLLKNETKIDVTDLRPEETAQQIIQLSELN